MQRREFLKCSGHFDDRTVVEYAENRLKAVRSQKLVFPIMGGLFVAFVVCLVWLVRQESDKLGEVLVTNRVFWAGFGAGVLFLSMFVHLCFRLGEVVPDVVGNRGRRLRTCSEAGT